jgi:signal transduction histidine kinase
MAIPLLSRAAARAERRRIAREIHDGLAQELAFVALQTRRMARAGCDEEVLELTDAAERAVAEARALITGLRSTGEEQVEEVGPAIARTARRLARRHGAKLELDVPRGIRMKRAAGTHLVRIVGEALSNSLTHGQARSVSVQLLDRNGLRLCVADDGRGFDPASEPPPKHFGLKSMRERAAEIGAELWLRSRPGAGTEIEVVLP